MVVVLSCTSKRKLDYPYENMLNIVWIAFANYLYEITHTIILWFTKLILSMILGTNSVDENQIEFNE